MAYEKSFLDIKKAYRKSKSNLNLIKIANCSKHPKIIEGILNTEVSLSVSANWQRLIDLDEILGGASKYLSAGLGINTLNTGKWTQKYYKGGSYLSLPVKFRIVDWDGTGNVVESAKTIISWATPRPSFRLSKEGEKEKTTTKSTTTEKVKSSISQIATNLWEMAGSVFNVGPSKVTIEISNYIKGGMVFVIDSVQTDFSKEITKSGPLYVDISMGLSSWTIMDSYNIPLHSNRKSRVKRVNGTGIPSTLVK